MSCVFLDVDLQESIQDCLEVLWEPLEVGCKVFVHDVDRPAVVQPFVEEALWSRHSDGAPPSFTGAQSGLGPLRRLLGFARKS